MIKKNCLQCNKEFKTWPSEIRKGGGKYCSRICSYKNRKPLSLQTKKKISESRKGDKNWAKRPEVRVKIAATLTGRDLGGYRRECATCQKEFRCNPSDKTKTCSRACSAKHQSKTRSGPLSPTWKGGITPESLRDRRGLKYKHWRTSVFERDEYTCQCCGQVGGKLQADHIKVFALFKELRFDINNGQTLCVSCHREKTKIDLLEIKKARQ